VYFQGFENHLLADPEYLYPPLSFLKPIQTEPTVFEIGSCLRLYQVVEQKKSLEKKTPDDDNALYRPLGENLISPRKFNFSEAGMSCPKQAAAAEAAGLPGPGRRRADQALACCRAVRAKTQGPSLTYTQIGR